MSDPFTNAQARIILEKMYGQHHHYANLHDEHLSIENAKRAALFADFRSRNAFEAKIRSKPTAADLNHGFHRKHPSTPEEFAMARVSRINKVALEIKDAKIKRLSAELREAEFNTIESRYMMVLYEFKPAISKIEEDELLARSG
ncbi:MAG: hypothetical protein M1828_006580 [Chrysothrix sp. TS-e1954]|nr:MAG: hypothetical protein M1828_006580 [Chrysothrix sp. TS-e1954]